MVRHPMNKRSKREEEEEQEEDYGHGKQMYSVRIPVDRGKRSTIWQSLGVAFGGQGDKGDGIQVVLNALPVGDWDGRFFLFPIREREED